MGFFSDRSAHFHAGMTQPRGWASQFVQKTAYCRPKNEIVASVRVAYWVRSQLPLCSPNLRLRAACRALGVGEITAHGLRHSAATILLNHVGKDLREIQELLRHKNIRTTVRYTHVGYEQTRQTAEALSRVLE